MEKRDNGSARQEARSHTYWGAVRARGREHTRASKKQRNEERTQLDNGRQLSKQAPLPKGRQFSSGGRRKKAACVGQVASYPYLPSEIQRRSTMMNLVWSISSIVMCTSAPARAGSTRLPTCQHAVSMRSAYGQHAVSSWATPAAGVRHALPRLGPPPVSTPSACGRRVFRTRSAGG